MDMIIPAFIGLLFIAYFVFLWFAARTWKWYDLTLLTLAFFLSIGFLPLAAGVFKVRTDWEKVRTEYAGREERASAELKKIKFGDDIGGVALVPLEIDLRQIRADAGRVWRGLRFDSGTANEMKLTLSLPAPNAAAATDPAAPADPAAAPADPAAAPAAPADPAAAPPANGAGPAAQMKIDEQAIVYAFAESDFEGRQIPRLYLGDFKVSQVAGDQVTLQPLLPLHPQTVQVMTGGQVTTVSLYELAPVDSHQVFIAPGSEANQEQIFGRVDEKLVRDLLEGKVPPKTLDAYLRDGTRSLPDDPDDSKWILLEFTRKHEITVDSPEKRSADDGNYFDSSGQAVDSRLQRGEPVVFEQGEQYYFKYEAAQELIDLGAAKLINTYFVRPLTDYRFIIFDIVNRLDRLVESTTILSRDRDVLQSAVDRTVEMQTREQDVKAKLELDLKQTVKEKEAAARYLAKLETELNGVRTRMASVYEQNLLIANQLAVVQAKLTKLIDARSTQPAR